MSVGASFVMAALPCLRFHGHIAPPSGRGEQRDHTERQKCRAMWSLYVAITSLIYSVKNVPPLDSRCRRAAVRGTERGSGAPESATWRLQYRPGPRAMRARNETKAMLETVHSFIQQFIHSFYVHFLYPIIPYTLSKTTEICTATGSDATPYRREQILGPRKR